MANRMKALTYRRRSHPMVMRKLTTLVLLFLMIAVTPAAPSGSIPRQSPEFTIIEPSGKRIQLSSFKGKVVMIEFFFLKSAKCLNLARTMNKLNAELGARGFQPIAVAFPAPQSDANGPLMAYMVDYFKLTYPVGYTSKDDVDRYLGRSQEEWLSIPQVVIIDRAGTIRAQTIGFDANPKLEDEDSLRTMLGGLLKEGVPAVSTKK